jgi:intracellular septation protein A
VSGGPSTQFLSEVSERIFRQGLGEDISSLFICANVVNADATGVDIITEMMILDRKVARMQFISFVCCKLAGTLVVFMYNDMWLQRVDVPYVHDSVK